MKIQQQMCLLCLLSLAVIFPVTAKANDADARWSIRMAESVITKRFIQERL